MKYKMCRLPSSNNVDKYKSNDKIVRVIQKTKPSYENIVIF